MDERQALRAEAEARHEILSMTQLKSIQTPADRHALMVATDHEHAASHKILVLHPDGRMFFAAEYEEFYAHRWHTNDERFDGHMMRCSKTLVDLTDLRWTTSSYSPCIVATDGALLLAPGLAKLFLAKSSLVLDVIAQIQYISYFPETQCMQAWDAWPSAKRKRLRYIMWCMRQVLPSNVQLSHVERLVLEFATDQKIDTR